MTASSTSLAPLTVGAAAVSAGALALATAPRAVVAKLPSAADFEAARFLAQASFGPKPSTIAEVRQLGLKGWIAQQADPAKTPSPTGFVDWVNRRNAEINAADPNHKAKAGAGQVEEALAD